MRGLVLLASLTLLSLPGCDTGGVPTGDCSAAQGRSDGTISARYGEGSFRLTCYNVSIVSGRTLVLGYDVSDGVTSIRLPITITIDGTTEGTYDLDGVGAGDDGDESFVQLGLGGDATSPAESGTIRVTEFSRTRLRGTFEFVTVSGVTVRGGEFNLGISGVTDVSPP